MNSLLVPVDDPVRGGGPSSQHPQRPAQGRCWKPVQPVFVSHMAKKTTRNSNLSCFRSLCFPTVGCLVASILLQMSCYSLGAHGSFDLIIFGPFNH